MVYDAQNANKFMSFFLFVTKQGGGHKKGRK